MGSYGIGVSRAVASIVEQNHDDRGLIWPASVAPADIHLIAIGKAGQKEAAEQLGEALERAGLRVLLDDRGTSAGVAFADADLLGDTRPLSSSARGWPRARSRSRTGAAASGAPSHWTARSPSSPRLAEVGCPREPA